MATQILAVNPPEVKTETIVIYGRMYQYVALTDRCWLFTAVKTGATRQFNSREAMDNYIFDLCDHLKRIDEDVHQIPQLAAPKIAGLLPPVAGLIPGQCESWLNAHDSPLATDGWVFVTKSGHKYCPHCFNAYHKAMDMSNEPTYTEDNVEFSKPHTYSGHKRIEIKMHGSMVQAPIEIRQMWNSKAWAIWQPANYAKQQCGRFISKPRALKETKKIALREVVGRTPAQLTEYINTRFSS